MTELREYHLFPVHNKRAFAIIPWKKLHRARISDVSLATLEESTLKIFKEMTLKFS